VPLTPSSAVGNHSAAESTMAMTFAADDYPQGAVAPSLETCSLSCYCYPRAVCARVSLVWDELSYLLPSPA
jgi:hypothetical protein